MALIELSDKDGRGNAIVDFWGPNKKKECTILIKKSKEHEERFVKILAKTIIQPFLDSFISGRRFDEIFHTKKGKSTQKNQQCDVCEKCYIKEISKDSQNKDSHTDRKQM